MTDFDTSGTQQPSRRWRPGPGLLVTAAFIGPGTVATASRAGAQFGYALLWSLVLAIAATIVLQEMAARLGLVARIGLAEAIRESIHSTWLRRCALSLVLTAIVLGNTAYQTGNLMGAGLGLSVLTGWGPQTAAAAVGAAITIIVYCGGSSRMVRGGLIAIVLAMSLAFLLTACIVRPDLSQAIRGSVVVSLPQGSLLTVLALIGTTVVPYNLCLHAKIVQQRWPIEGDTSTALSEARIDTVVSISIGGFVTMAIIVTAAAAFYGAGKIPSSAADLAEQLKPLLGEAGQSLFAASLTAAGLTSAITAPIAAGYAAAGAMPQMTQRTSTLIATAVALIGTLSVFFLGKSPQTTIIAAQAANGMVLPIVAAFLLWVMNRHDLIGEHRNGWKLNLAGVSVVLITCFLGLKSLWTLWL